jgi:RNA polymerase sigma-70 factor, ECF subfamily
MGDNEDDELAAKFRAIYERHYRAVVRFLINGLRVPAAEAEDIAQETFVRFWESIRDYRGEAEWAFLEIVARRVYFNKRRADLTEKRRVETNATSLDDIRHWQEPAAKHDDLADRELAQMIVRRLREAMRALPDKQRECLLMRLEGFKYEQIAAILAVTVDAVKSRLRDAKKKLHADLSDLERLPWPEVFPEDEP